MENNDFAKMLVYWVAQANISKMEAQLALEWNADRRKCLQELLVVEQYKLLPL